MLARFYLLAVNLSSNLWRASNTIQQGVIKYIPLILSGFIMGYIGVVGGCGRLWAGQSSKGAMWNKL
jgi:hypothetical protein